MSPVVLDIEISTIVGGIATVLAVLSLVPQVRRTWKTRSAVDLSAAWLLIALASMALWVVYGISTKAWAVAFANAITLVLVLILLVMKFWLEFLARAIPITYQISQPSSDIPTKDDPRQDKELRDIGGHFLRQNQPEIAIAYFEAVYERDRNNLISVGEYCRALIAGGNWSELKKVARDTDFKVFDSNRPEYLHDLDELERQIYLEVCLDVCQTPEAIAQLSRAVRHVVNNGYTGDFVECGVYKGASIVCIIRTLQALGINNRRIWLYDTFEGMPRPEAVDVFYTQSIIHDWSIKTWEFFKRDDVSDGSNWVYGPLEEVRAFVLRTGYPEDKLRFVKGLVEDTIPAMMPESICLMRLDTDFYRSTKHELQYLYPLLQKGGALFLDDYGAYQGARQATDEFIKENRLNVLLCRVDEHVRMLVKT